MEGYKSDRRLATQPGTWDLRLGTGDWGLATGNLDGLPDPQSTTPQSTNPHPYGFGVGALVGNGRGVGSE